MDQGLTAGLTYVVKGFLFMECFVQWAVVALSPGSRPCAPGGFALNHLERCTATKGRFCALDSLI